MAQQGEKTPSPSRYRSMVVEEARAMDFDPDVALSDSRARGAAICRMRAWKRLHSAGFGLSGIGRAANKDHTTILSGLRRLEKGFAPAQDYTGQTVGRLTVVRRFYPSHPSPLACWQCECACGRPKFVTSQNLRDKRQVAMCDFCRLYGTDSPDVDAKKQCKTTTGGLANVAELI